MWTGMAILVQNEVGANHASQKACIPAETLADPSLLRMNFLQRSHEEHSYRRLVPWMKPER